MTLTFDLWPWPFAWTSLLSLVITPENFIMIRWWEHSQKGVTDGQTKDRRTDGRTENTICRAAWSQLKTIGHLFYTMSNIVHHFKAISEFKLQLQSGKAQFGSKLVIFLSCVTSKFDGWPWKTIGHLFYTMSSFVLFQRHLLIQTRVTVWKCSIRVKISDFFVPCDLELWQMTLNKANLRDLKAATGL